MNKKTLPIYLAFLAMGFGDVVGPLVSLAKQTFALSNFAAQLLPFAGFLTFGLLSVPMGVLQDRRGKKPVLLLGLSAALLGLLIPIIAGLYGPAPLIPHGNQSLFIVVLASIFILGAGATTLQVVGNPVMRDVSADGRYARNLSLAQGIKAIGSSLGFLVPPLAAVAFGLDWPVLFPLFAGILLLALVLSLRLEIKETRLVSAPSATIKSCLSLLSSHPFILKTALGIFLYVGAEVCFSTGVPLLLKERYGLSGLGLWVSWSLFFLPILAGRFAGAVVLSKTTPRRFLALTCALALLGILAVLTGVQALALVGVVLTGLGFANVFPLIFSLAIESAPTRANEISGLMVTAIVGGALLPPLMGSLADATSVQTGFLVPLAALACIGVFTVGGARPIAEATC